MFRRNKQPQNEMVNGTFSSTAEEATAVPPAPTTIATVATTSRNLNRVITGTAPTKDENFAWVD